MQKYELNEKGVPQFPKGHAGRLLVTLATIDYLDRPTCKSISDFTGLHRAMIDEYVQSLNEQLMTQIVKDGPVFRIESWGSILNASGIRDLLTCHFI